MSMLGHFENNTSKVYFLGDQFLSFKPHARLVKKLIKIAFYFVVKIEKFIQSVYHPTTSFSSQTLTHENMYADFAL